MACLAQFYPLKYPASFWLLVGCVSTYAVLSALMTYVAAVLERDGFAFTQPNPKKVCARVEDSSSKALLLQGQSVFHERRHS